MPFTLVAHPVLKDRLTRLRDAGTPPPAFRAALREAAGIIALLATADLGTEPVRIRTPLSDTTGERVASSRLMLVPILRAGLGMVEPVQALFPEASVHHVGVYRDEETRQPVPYYVRPPGKTPADTALVLDPMLATGGSAVFTLKLLSESGVRDIRLLAIVAAPEGVAKVEAAVPGARVFAAALDAGLDERAFIVPGLGDAGDRQFDAT